MFTKLLDFCENHNSDIVYAANVRPDGGIHAVIVNNGGNNAVIFGSEKSARQFVRWLLSLGIGSIYSVL